MSDLVFDFEVPDTAGPDLRAVAELAAIVDRLRAGTQLLADEHAALRQQVEALAKRKKRPGPPSVRWNTLNRPDAATVWAWLIGWVGWFVDRYGLQEEIGACWPHHPALVEELTALCLSWHGAYADTAPADAPLRWHEALDKARFRLTGWDQHTKCRLGTHNDRPDGYQWPDRWSDDAYTVAQDDGRHRPVPPPTDAPAPAGARTGRGPAKRKESPQ